MTCRELERQKKRTGYWQAPLSVVLINKLIQLRGRCSGIPDCCIRWFSGEYHSLSLSGHGRAYMATTPPGIKYVPCPRCLASQAFVKVRECQKDEQGDCACACAYNFLLDFPPTVRTEALALYVRQNRICEGSGL